MIKKVILFIALALMFTACEREQTITPSGKTIEIGVLAPLSGEDKRLGHQSILGLQAAKKLQKYLNNGDEVVFKILDTKTEIKSTKKALNTLASENVKSIFSFMSSKEMTTLAREFYHTKIPIITTLATDNHIARESTYISQVCIDNNTQTLVAAHYIKDEKFIQNVGVIYNKNNHYSSVLAEEFQKYFSKLGGEIDFFIDISTPLGFKKFQEQNKKKTKMLFNTTNAKMTAKILKILESKKLSFDILGTDGLLSGALELPRDDLKLFDGVYVIEHYAHNTKRDDTREKLEELLAKDGFSESSYAFLAYDGYQLLLHALNSCPDYNKECIKHTLQNSSTIKGILSNFTIIDAKAKREVYVDKIKNAKLQKEVVIY